MPVSCSTYTFSVSIRSMSGLFFLAFDSGVAMIPMGVVGVVGADDPGKPGPRIEKRQY
jgi:hypothetical protein